MKYFAHINLELEAKTPEEACKLLELTLWHEGLPVRLLKAPRFYRAAKLSIDNGEPVCRLEVAE